MLNVTQRQVSLGIMAVFLLGTIMTLLAELVGGRNPLLLVTSGTSVVAFSTLFVAYWQGWEYARHILIVFLTLAVSFSLPDLNDQIFFGVFLPSIAALILLNPWWIAGSGVFVISTLLIRAGGQGVYATPPVLIVYIMIIVGAILARLVSDTAQRTAIANGQRAEVALVETERQAHELAQRASDLEANNEQQRRLLDLVATLETPAVALADGVVLAPIVGHLDSRRAEALTERLLHEVSQRRTRVVILDIAGVSTVDTAVAQSLLRAVQALRLLGCEVNLTGISSSVAATITHLGIDLSGVSIARTPQDALANIALINRTTNAAV